MEEAEKEDATKGEEQDGREYPDKHVAMKEAAGDKPEEEEACKAAEEGAEGGGHGEGNADGAGEGRNSEEDKERGDTEMADAEKEADGEGAEADMEDGKTEEDPKDAGDEEKKDEEQNIFSRCACSCCFVSRNALAQVAL